MGCELEIKKTLCSMCALNCGLLVYVRDGKIIKIRGNPDNPVSGGFTVKGWQAPFNGYTAAVNSCIR
jgi:anaerobic selenocysteine-containing dehydrogenase